MAFTDPSIELDRLLAALPPARSVGIAEVGVPPESGELLLVLDPTLDGRQLAELVRAAAAAGAAGVLVDPVHPLPDRTGGLPVLVRPAGVSWRQLHARLDQPRLVADDELADLAQTIATLTGGLVTIEDTAARVLAYSRSSDEVDELRRLSILGRSGPPAYLTLLREWGVYDRLAAAEEVVEIAEHPATGVRRRLAVGVFAGSRQLGTIWVQQGAAEFGPHARQALLGAARLTAAQLVGRTSRRPATGSRLTDLLAGRSDAEQLGRDAHRPAAVAVFAAGTGPTDPAEQAQRLDELAGIVTVHAAAFRRQSLVERSGSRVLVLLPAVSAAQLPEAEAMLEQTVAAIRRHLDPAVRAALGPVVDRASRAAESARGADRLLRLPATEPVLSFSRARNRLIAAAVRDFLSQQDDLLDARVTALIQADPEAGRTLLRYLDTGSDVARVARELAVHPTTVRHRLRRVSRQLELDLAEPDDRLAVQLQLRQAIG